MIVACPTCKAKFKIDEGRIKPPGVRLRCARCQNLFAVRKRVVDRPAAAPPDRESAPPRGPSPGGAMKVLLAHGEPAILAAMQAALEKEDCEVLVSEDGVDALMKIQREQPAAVVIDVALPKMYGFEICEFLKRNESLSAIKVTLVATEHNHRRYKRTPENFYGADDVIEEGDIADGLSGRLRRLLHGPEEPREDRPSGDAPPEARPAIPAEQDREEPDTGVSEDALRPSLDGTVEAPAAVPGPAPGPRVAAPAPSGAEAGGEGPGGEAREKARRLARIIVSDIALYNPESVEKGIRNGELASLIRDDLEEGYKLFRSRIDESVSAERDFIREALDAFVERKRRDLGLAEAPPADETVEESAVADDMSPTSLEGGHDDF